MKKVILVGGILSCVILGYFLIGKNDIQAMQVLALEKQESGLATIIHMPTDKQINTVREQLRVETYRADTVDETLLIVPYEADTIVGFYTLEYKGDNLQEREKLREYRLEKADHVIYAEVPVPCGIPTMKIVVEAKGEIGEYTLSYDGKGDRPQVETIKVKE